MNDKEPVDTYFNVTNGSADGCYVFRSEETGHFCCVSEYDNKTSKMI